MHLRTFSKKVPQLLGSRRRTSQCSDSRSARKEISRRALIERLSAVNRRLIGLVTQDGRRHPQSRDSKSNDLSTASATKDSQHLKNQPLKCLKKLSVPSSGTRSETFLAVGE